MPKEIRNQVVIVALAMMWTLQVTALMAFVLRFINPPVSTTLKVFVEWQYLLKPEWDSVVYHVAIVVAVIFFLALRWWVNRFFKSVDLLGAWKIYLIMEVCCTMMGLAALFKVVVYWGQPQLGSMLFIGMMLLAMIIKFQMSALARMWEAWIALLNDDRLINTARLLFPLVMSMMIILAIGIPNIKGVVARNFIGEQFHHNDSFLMGPALSFLSSQRLDIDVISQYGIGFVAIIAKLSTLIGGFSYESVMTIMVWGTVFYYLAWFWLLRKIIKDPLIICTAMCLMIKWQLLQPGAYPLVYTYGSQTPIRFIYDVLFFWLLWFYWQKPSLTLLTAAASVVGFGIYYFTSEGIYAAAAFGGMLVLIMFNRRLRALTNINICQCIALMLVIPLVAVGLLWLTVGSDVFSTEFWKNIGEFIQYFTNYFGLEPMTKTLAAKQFLASAIGFIIPIVYLVTLLIIGARVLLGQAPAWQMWIVTLAIYGLGTYHYYIARSVVTSYYTVCIPLIIILAFWYAVIVQRVKDRFKSLLRWGMLLTVFIALITTHQWISYPNFINCSRNPLVDPNIRQQLPNGQPYFNHLFRDQAPNLLKEDDFLSDDEVVSYYQSMTDFSVDAKLIKELTDPQDEVAIISSFEIELLRQANRKPFFYYFPLVISHPLEASLVPATSIYTHTQLSKVVSKFDKERPRIIFIARDLANIQLTADLSYRYPSTIELLTYIYKNYEFNSAGKYLIALKRR